VRRNEVGTPAEQPGQMRSPGGWGSRDRPPVRRHDFRPALAVGLLGVAVVAVLVTIVISRHGPAAEPTKSPLGGDLFLALWLVYPVVGTFIVVHRPDNAVGWIVGAIGFFPLLGNLGGEYAGQARLRHATDWPLLDLSLWLNNWYYFAIIGPLPLLFLLYPDGRPLSRRWRPLVWLTVAGLIALLMVGMLGPGDDPRLPNPYAADLPSAVGVILAPVLLALPLGAVGGLLSLGLRYRRARGVERQQVTLLLYSAVLAVAFWSLDSLIPDGFSIAAFFLPPLAIGIALSRYRLYDIDRLVSRTVSYALLTALLAAPYVLVVTTASRVAGSNQLAVALATLAAAAAFNPLRRRIQNRVDRRFNRARYDAGRTVEAFTQRLREEIDLQTVRADLLAVVAQTVQPTSASLWLRSGP
jgi:hypothetical protein